MAVYRSAWRRETAYPLCQPDWDQDAPAIGQCLITVIANHAIFGGQIIGGDVWDIDGASPIPHYKNILEYDPEAPELTNLGDLYVIHDTWTQFAQNKQPIFFPIFEPERSNTLYDHIYKDDSLFPRFQKFWNNCQRHPDFPISHHDITAQEIFDAFLCYIETEIQRSVSPGVEL